MFFKFFFQSKPFLINFCNITKNFFIIFIVFFFIKIFNYYFYFEYTDFLYIYIFYFFLNVFFYFYTTYQISTFTLFIKNFWIRSFFLFWAIEFFLYSIFVYLLLICPEKQYYAFEILNNHTFSKRNFINSNYMIFILFTTIFMLNCFILLKQKSHINLYIIYFFITSLLFIIFRQETKMFFSALSVMSDINY